MYESVEVARSVDGERINRFQVVRERRTDYGSEEWVVVGFADESVRLADPTFESTREVAIGEFVDGRFEVLEAGGVPVWGY